MAHLKAFLQRKNIFARQSSIAAFLGTMTDVLSISQLWIRITFVWRSWPKVVKGIEPWREFESCLKNPLKLRSAEICCFYFWKLIWVVLSNLIAMLYKKNKVKPASYLTHWQIFTCCVIHCTDGPTDGQTDRRTDQRTDRPSYRDAMTHLKKPDT